MATLRYRGGGRAAAIANGSLAAAVVWAEAGVKGGIVLNVISIRWIAVVLIWCTLLGCGGKRVIAPPPPQADLSFDVRSIGQEEILEKCERDPELNPASCREILARLNIKDPTYISKDIASGRALKVPNDFSSYKKWTPLPARLPQVADQDKFILVIKDIPFLGWYEQGRLHRDTQICIGKKPTWTKAGRYTVKEKDPSHISQSYRSALGYPALMPFALRIYGRVWIHGGDVVGGYCSHGCINLPLDAAEELFVWADKGTGVLVADSLENLPDALKNPSKRSARKPQSPGRVDMR